MLHKIRDFIRKHFIGYRPSDMLCLKEKDKKIEKLGLTYLKDDDRNEIIDKINEIIDVINKGDQMKEYTEFTLADRTKWELINYIKGIAKNINKAIKILDKQEGVEIGKAIQLLRCENVRIDNKNIRRNKS